MFKALIGDLFASQAQTLVNTVNCVGIMGKGVAQEFKQRYPEMFGEYAKLCAAKKVRLGEPYLYRDLTGLSVLNFPTKDDWRSVSRLLDIERGLDFFTRHYQEWGIRSIAFPPLGCGNGGLKWEDVGPLIFRKLSHLGIEVEVYAPYGTPKNQLSNEFLASPLQMELNDRGSQPEKMNEEWVVLMEVLLELENQPYTCPVGRTIFQKICYVVTELGVDTGFQFGKGSYGPFADEAKSALHDFANRNWLQEEKLGQMIALRVSDRYKHDRKKYADVLRRHASKIERTVDLFSRIKNTEQAEEALTVLFASKQLKRAHPGRQIDEAQLFDFILDWKKAWRSEAKRESVATAIRSLVALGWMRLQFSEALPDMM